MTSLAGKRILITRPRAQAIRLAERLRSVGALPIEIPAIEIVALHDAGRKAVADALLAGADVVVFISANAVENGLRLVGAAAVARCPVVIAIGAATAVALSAAGIAGVRSPRERFDSEAVLAMPELAEPAGRRVVVFRGVGGREVLAAALRARGATVDYIECYSRRAPEGSAAIRDAAANVDAVSFTSSEGIDNFKGMIGVEGWRLLAQVPAFVPHARIAAHARGCGLRYVHETASGDDELIAVLEAFFVRVPEVAGATIGGTPAPLASADPS